jgi:ribulose 1,5-bisphosphate synthetase/thiazole synthase
MATVGDDGAADVVGLGALGAGIGHMPASWDLEADVVIIGAGATGLPAAIKARDEGASVLVVEAN